MLDWVDETPTGLDQVSAFSEDGNRAARIRVESFTPDVHKGVILEAMTVHEATGLTPSQLQARVAELEAALRELLSSTSLKEIGKSTGFRDLLVTGDDVRAGFKALGEV